MASTKIRTKLAAQDFIVKSVNDALADMRENDDFTAELRQAVDDEAFKVLRMFGAVRADDPKMVAAAKRREANNAKRAATIETKAKGRGSKAA